MPRRVDHDQRRREIADAVARLAASNGFIGISFREVASEAGMSVANVQHYYGSKHDMLVGALDRQSAVIEARITRRLGELGAAAAPLEQIRVIVAAFIPTDDATTEAMRVYHGFAGAAVADPALRSAEAFARGRQLIAALSDLLSAAVAAGDARSDLDPGREATSLLALVLGLSLCVLLDQMRADEASAALEHHLHSFVERQ